MCGPAIDLHHFDSSDFLTASVGANLPTTRLRLEQSCFRSMLKVTITVKLIR